MQPTCQGNGEMQQPRQANRLYLSNLLYPNTRNNSSFGRVTRSTTQREHSQQLSVGSGQRHFPPANTWPILYYNSTSTFGQDNPFSREIEIPQPQPRQQHILNQIPIVDMSNISLLENNSSIGRVTRSTTQRERSRQLSIGSGQSHFPPVNIWPILSYNSPSAFGQDNPFSREIEIRQLQPPQPLPQQHILNSIPIVAASNVSVHENNPSVGRVTQNYNKNQIQGSSTHIPNVVRDTSSGKKSPILRGIEIQQHQHIFDSIHMVDSSDASFSKQINSYFERAAQVCNQNQDHIPTLVEDTLLMSISPSTSFAHNSSPLQQHSSQPTPTAMKHQQELEELRRKIKYHKINIRYLKNLGNKLDHEIAECKIAIANIAPTNTLPDEDACPGDTEEVINNILRCEKNLAAVFCKIKYQTDMPDSPLLNDVIGILALLGATDDASLSSMLAKYLGQDNMLSLVCKTSECVKALESYNEDGSVDTSSDIHAFAADVMGVDLEGRFHVICLDDLLPYPGGFMDNDPHKRLDLAKPLLNGKIPTGFLGFAVNMIFIESSNMYCGSKAGSTLRETLFYNLFSSLQVYRTKEDMYKAQPVIRNGAISLDGGMIRGNGVFSTGHMKRYVEVKFPIRSKGSIRTDEYYAIENKINETTWKKRRFLEDLQRAQELLDHAKSTLELKKTEIASVLANGSPYATQVEHASTPR